MILEQLAEQAIQVVGPLLAQPEIPRRILQKPVELLFRGVRAARGRTRSQSPARKAA